MASAVWSVVMAAEGMIGGVAVADGGEEGVVKGAKEEGGGCGVERGSGSGGEVEAVAQWIEGEGLAEGGKGVEVHGGWVLSWWSGAVYGAARATSPRSAQGGPPLSIGEQWRGEATMAG